MVISIVGCVRKFLLKENNMHRGLKKTNFYEKIKFAIRGSRGLKDNMSLLHYYDKSEVPKYANFWS